MKRIIATIALALAISLTVSSAFASPWRWTGNQKNTAGWQLMTQEERTEHQTKLRSFTEYTVCKEYVAEHHKQMEERAKEKGVAMPVMRRNPCDMMKAKGLLK
jgi:hypothetical protein